MKKILIYYCFTITTLMTFIGFFSATSIPQLISASFFFPITVYFGISVFPKRKKALEIPAIILKPAAHKKIIKASVTTKPTEPIILKQQDAEDPEAEPTKSFDIDRRAFIKLIGSAGLSVFVFSLFTKKAEAAFFGSVPGPGTIALKDSTGALVDPAAKQPTDGYKISEVDDSTPAYYGFVDKTGAWFIMQEGGSGAYRYIKGASSFSTNWTNRAGLTYQYFDQVF